MPPPPEPRPLAGLLAVDLQHADAPEGVTAFKEKRPPRWTLSKTRDFPTELFDDGR